MRVITRFNTYLKLYSHQSIYHKGNQLRTIHLTHSNLLQKIIKQEIQYPQPINKLSVSNLHPENHQQHSNKATKVKPKEVEGHEEINKKKNKEGKQATSKQKNKSSSESKESEDATRGNQHTIMKQFPVLNYLKNAMNQTVTNSFFHWTRPTQKSTEVQQQNSRQFLKVVSHSLSRQSATRVIKLVQEYCGQVKGKNDKLEVRERRQRKLYNRIKKTLEKQLIMSKNQGIRSDQVGMMLQALRDTSPKSINMTNYEKNMFMMDLDSGTLHTSPFKATTGSQMFQKQEKGSPLKVDYSKSKGRNKKAFYKAIRMREEAAKVEENPAKLRIESQVQIQPMIETNASPDYIVCRQISSSAFKDSYKQHESNKYVYIYDMPYNLTDSNSRQLLSYLEQMKAIKVSQFILFPYKHILSHGRFQVAFKVPENYGKQKIERVYKKTNIEDYLFDDKKGHRQKSDKKKKNVVNNEGEVEPQYDNTLYEAADSIISKIRKEDYSKYNRSAMVIKLSSIEDKHRIVNNWTRLFGINFQEFKNIKFQEGHSKTTVVISNIPIGCQSTELVEILNTTLKTQDLQISVDQDCYLTRHHVLVQFLHFVDALKGIQLINRIVFQGKSLSAQLKYGPMRVLKGEYKTIDDNFRTWKRLDDIGDQYLTRFEEEDRVLLI